LKDLFPFKDDQIDDNHEGLRKHALQVMTSIDDAIKLVGAPDELKDSLIELGVIHNMQDVQVDSFAVS